jgi:hypothetical protein
MLDTCAAVAKIDDPKTHPSSPDEGGPEISNHHVISRYTFVSASAARFRTAQDLNADFPEIEAYPTLSP